jgi:hypothetical protein
LTLERLAEILFGALALVVRKRVSRELAVLRESNKELSNGLRAK